MHRLEAVSKRAVLVLFLICAVSVACGCATAKVNVEHLPPVLAQDEILRPYEKVGSIQVSKERYGEELTAEDYTWAYYSLRQEAGRIGADAVILPEVRLVTQTHTIFPTTEVTGKGVAIKFR